MKYFIKNYLVTLSVIFCLAIGAIAFWKSQKRTTKKNDETFVVGVMSGYAPFALVNAQGKLEGFDIDVAEEIAKRLNKKLVLKDMSLVPLFLALQQGKIDVLLSGLSITEKRKKKIFMIWYQGTPTTSFPLVFWQKIPTGISVIEDLKKFPGAQVCVEPGSSQEDFLRQCSFLNIKPMSVMSEIVMDLKYRKSLAALIDPDIFPVLKQQMPELVTLQVSIPKEYQIMGCGIGIKKENKQRIEQITNIVDVLKREGILQTLETKWFKERREE